MTQDRNQAVSINSGTHRAELLRRRDDLVASHLGLARSIALYVARSLPKAFELDDLISTGYLGLLRAATNYNPRLHNGTPFSAYARSIIRGAIVDSIRRGKYIENTRPKIEDIERDLPAPESEFIARIDQERLRERVDVAVVELDRRHRKVVGWHYDGEERLPKIGRRLRVGKSRASQLHMEAIRALRAKLVRT